MSLQILAVGMLDYKTFGTEQFFVQINDEEIMFYEVHVDGKVTPVVDEPAPLRYLTASIEKFNNTYRIAEPIPLSDLSELHTYIGKFELVSDTQCRYTG